MWELGCEGVAAGEEGSRTRGSRRARVQGGAGPSMESQGPVGVILLEAEGTCVVRCLQNPWASSSQRVQTGTPKPSCGKPRLKICPQSAFRNVCFYFSGFYDLTGSHLLWTHTFGVRADLLIHITFVNKPGAIRKITSWGPARTYLSPRSRPELGVCGQPPHSPGPCQRFKGV